MKNNSLVLLWQGKEIPDNIVTEIANLLTINGVCVPELLKIKYFDEDSIISTLVSELSSKEEQSKFVSKLEFAMKYISTKFEDAIKRHDGFGLYVGVFGEYEEIRHRINDDSDVAFINAMEIVATHEGSFPKTLLKKYNFTENTIKVIKEAYKRYHKYVSRTI